MIFCVVLPALPVTAIVFNCCNYSIKLTRQSQRASLTNNLCRTCAVWRSPLVQLPADRILHRCPAHCLFHFRSRFRHHFQRHSGRFHCHFDHFRHSAPPVHPSDRSNQFPTAFAPFAAAPAWTVRAHRRLSGWGSSSCKVSSMRYLPSGRLLSLAASSVSASVI